MEFVQIYSTNADKISIITVPVPIFLHFSVIIEFFPPRSEFGPRRENKCGSGSTTLLII